MNPETIQMLVWAAIAVVCIVAEASTACLIAVWFIGGAAAGFITAACGGAFWLQCVLFAVVSALLLLCLRPFIRKFVNPQKINTNVNSVIGKHALVTQSIDNLRGQGAVRLGGIEWTARSSDDRPIDEQTEVCIVRVEGVKAIVEPVKVPAKEN